MIPIFAFNFPMLVDVRVLIVSPADPGNTGVILSAASYRHNHCVAYIVYTTIVNDIVF